MLVFHFNINGMYLSLIHILTMVRDDEPGAGKVFRDFNEATMAYQACLLYTSRCV